ncbi:MAG: DUF2442 domain-containing protein [Acidimicrobiales bacterium]
MAALARVSHVEVVAECTLRVVFSDGLVRELDFAGVLAGVLAGIDDDDTFASVGADPVAGTVCWPGGIDVDPDVLHGEAPAAVHRGPRLVRQYGVEQAS